MCCKGLEWVRRFGVVVGKEEVAYAVVQGVVETSLALEGIPFAQSAILKKEAYDFVVSTEASQNERCIVKLVFRIHIDTFRYHALNN